ncbi:hypothetical protein [Sinorhizobium meliloti]|uniref:hypothetical protein n=1 Tax=Rhizobium meliloti TaxID=382 RepID=UPI001F1ADEC1|nr:hypothetical protein [Sinorhizobium meliloti]
MPQLIIERRHEDIEAVLAAIPLDDGFHAPAFRKALVDGRHALIAWSDPDRIPT